MLSLCSSQVDIHTPHFHGNTLKIGRINRDEVEMVPGSTVTADMIPDDGGRWLFHCHVNDHLIAGMIMMFDVEGPFSVPKGCVREVFLAAVEEEWDYAPEGNYMCGPTPRPFAGDELIYAGGTDGDLVRIGTKYRKTRYVRFTDATFTTRARVPADEAHAGIMGPVIRAIVGDTIVIRYKNMASFTNSFHPHGVFYEKHSEGAPYEDMTGPAMKMDDMVEPGQSHTYVLAVPARAGPTPEQGSSRMWLCT
jgi:FtsP/CotA-like multicopper oxidase with cupredoxin domain